VCQPNKRDSVICYGTLVDAGLLTVSGLDLPVEGDSSLR